MSPLPSRRTPARPLFEKKAKKATAKKAATPAKKTAAKKATPKKDKDDD